MLPPFKLGKKDFILEINWIFRSIWINVKRQKDKNKFFAFSVNEIIRNFNKAFRLKKEKKKEFNLLPVLSIVEILIGLLEKQTNKDKIDIINIKYDISI